MTYKMYTIQELYNAGMYGPAHCTCLDEYDDYITSSGYCSFCDTIDKLDGDDHEEQAD